MAVSPPSGLTDLNPSPRILLGPGPSMVHPRVMAALGMPVVGHLDPDFIHVMDEVQDLLRYVFEASEDTRTISVSGTGSAGMESAIANFVEEGDPVLMCVSGYFSERITEMATRYGADVRRLDVPWGEVISGRQVDEALQARPAKIVAVVHGETSTGALQPLEEVAEAAHRHGALLLVDTVASLGGSSVGFERNGIDICYSGSQKCLSAPPGLAPLALSPRAMDVLMARESKVRSWYLDLTLLFSYWGEGRRYHHTAPVSMNYALREALRLAAEEGLEARFERHAQNAQMLWDGLAALDMVPLLPADIRMPMLTTVRLPEGLDEAAIRRRLLAEYNIEIAGGLGAFAGKVWRIGLMGYSSRRENVVTLLGALEHLLD